MIPMFRTNCESVMELDTAYTDCPNCGRETRHIFRMYKIQTKLYSVIPIGSTKCINIVCDVCYMTRRLKPVETDLLENYKKMLELEAVLLR
jgi:hypothetical protein